MEVVFVKTAKGREEVDTKAGGVSSRYAPSVNLYQWQPHY